MSDIKVQNALFDPFELRSEESNWQMRVTVTGTGMIARGKPIMARVGDVEVEGIFVLPDNLGFAGFLAREPDPGSRLIVHYLDEPDEQTDVVYNPAVA